MKIALSITLSGVTVLQVMLEFDADNRINQE